MTLIRSQILAAAAVALLALPASAANKAELDRLFEALGTAELLDIMRTEGLVQADELQTEMFPGRGGRSWHGLASAIYDTGDMAATFRVRFDEELAETDVTPLLEYFDSDAGSRIIELELSGRRALVDSDLEEAAREAYADLSQSGDPRVDQIQSFVDANDLIELNVMGAMNASLAFYRGLSDGGGFDMGEEQMLTEVWSQEPSIRDDTSTWLYAYLALAYRPVSDAALDTYVEVTSSPAGRDLNRALFAGFDDVFRDVSYGLGRAASRFMTSEEL